MMVPSSRRNTRPTAVPQSLILLEDIRLTVGQESGVLSFLSNRQPCGAVLIEKGEVCWATTRRTRNRLAGLLLERSNLPLEREDIEAAYVRCRESGKPLLDVLGSVCELEEEDLRQVLRQHTVEALRELSNDATNSKFLPHLGAGFGATYSFEYSELYVQMCSTADQATQVRVGELLKGLLSGNSFALAYRSDLDEAPLGISGKSWLRLTDLAELSSWVRTVVEVSQLLVSSANSVVLSSPSRDSVVIGAIGDSIVVVFCEGDESLAYAMAMIDMKRSAMTA